MPYKFLPEAAVADIAFLVREKELDRFFEQAAEATFACMADLATIRQNRTETVSVEATNLDHLLYDFLSELIFIKDKKRLLFSSFRVRIAKKAPGYKLTATVKGAPITPEKQKLRNDVKAITMHRFGIKKTNAGFEAQVTVDI